MKKHVRLSKSETYQVMMLRKNLKIFKKKRTICMILNNQEANYYCETQMFDIETKSFWFKFDRFFARETKLSAFEKTLLLCIIYFKRLKTWKDDSIVKCQFVNNESNFEYAFEVLQTNISTIVNWIEILSLC